MRGTSATHSRGGRAQARSPKRALEVYAMDVALNAQGLRAWLDSIAAGQSS
jgi:hypothetical protein